MLEKYVVAKYLRLSSADGDKRESESIENQRSLIDCSLPKYFAGVNIETIELVDDGYSGTNMNRPGMQRLLELAEAGKIDCVAVKDFSRFARDYVDFGTYAEKKFPLWGIRFISVNDGYDSADFCGIAGGADMALKSIAHTMYSRDLSEKNKSAVRVLNKNGKFTGAFCLYGYKKSPDDKRRLITDPAAAETVKRIFDMRAGKMTSAKIARLLNSEGIMPPAKYREFTASGGRKNSGGYSQWSPGAVERILHNEQYTGLLISGKSECTVTGGKKKRLTSEKSRIVAENAVDAIISRELYDSVQTERKPRKRTAGLGALFRGKLRCGGCGHMMDAYRISGQGYKYYCRYEGFNDEHNCVRERIYESDLCELVRKLIKSELQRAPDIRRINEKITSSLRKKEQTLRAAENKINAEKRKKLVDYIRLAKGELSEADFTKKSEITDNKITEYTERTRILHREMTLTDTVPAEELFERYAGGENLNRAVAEDLIKAIYAYDDKRIEVVWDFTRHNY